MANTLSLTDLRQLATRMNERYSGFPYVDEEAVLLANETIGLIDRYEAEQLQRLEEHLFDDDDEH